MDYIKITLKPGKEDSFHRFHPWVFSGAIYRFEKQPEEGDIVSGWKVDGKTYKWQDKDEDYRPIPNR